MSEPLDPTKYFVLTLDDKKKLIIGLLLFVTIIIFPLMILYYSLAVKRPAQSDKATTFQIGKGESIFEISQRLQDRGVLNSEVLFITYVYLNGYEKNIQAGIYDIKAGSSVVDLVNLFQNGRNDIKLIFLEGWRVEEYGVLASESLPNINYEKFIEIAKPYEGYLFPDTYYANEDVREDELVNLLRENFEDKTKDIIKDTDLSKLQLTKEQVIIIASILERESSNKEDAKKVAGILIKRFREDMKLDADATTQYAVAYKDVCDIYNQNQVCVPTMDQIKNMYWWPKSLSLKDLDFDSPYNTRKNLGLPPTPICNPSLSSIEAVIKYEETPYYYYLNDISGKTYFAKTLEEHNNNIANYLNN